MIPTIAWLQERFREDNIRYFNGELPTVPIELCTAKTFWGQFVPNNICRGWRRKIRISTRFDRPEFMVEQTLIHEMIHLWQDVNGYPDVHGKSFKTKAAEINKDGWNITRCSSPEGAIDTNTKERTGYIVVFKLVGYGANTRRVAFTTSVDTARRIMKMPWDIMVDREAYQVKGKEYNKMRNCCSRLTYYTYNEEDYQEKIVSTIVAKESVAA